MIDPTWWGSRSHRFSLIWRQGRIFVSTGIDLLLRWFRLNFDASVTRSGNELISILLTFQNQGSVGKSAFLTNAQSRFASAVVLAVSWDLRA